MSKKKFASSELSRLCAQSSYDYHNKKAYLAMGRLILNRLAESMRLGKGEYSVRLCEGGIAVPGEIILHSEHLYLQICPSWSSPTAQIMFRSCKGQKDYTGGQNNWSRIEVLDDLETFADKLLDFIERTAVIPA